MKNIPLSFIFFIGFIGGLAAQQSADNDFRYIQEQNAQRDNDLNRPSYDGRRREKLDSRKPSDKLELKRPIYQRLLQERQPNVQAKPAFSPQISEQLEKQQENTAASAPKMPIRPVSGPGNPLAPPFKRTYPPMPDGDKIFECRYCHYIYYTLFQPDGGPCELKGHVHEWQILGQRGYLWYRCVRCNCHVCSTATPLRAHCGAEGPHVWEPVKR